MKSVASFVTTATVYRTQFEASVLSAEPPETGAVGALALTCAASMRERGRAIDALYVPLGSNPFTSLPGQQSVALIRVPNTISLAQMIRANNLASQGIDVAALQRLNPQIRSNSTVAAGTVIWLRHTGGTCFSDRFRGNSRSLLRESLSLAHSLEI